ncbi:MAG TPA: hypothetical protein VF431_04775 [Candidatus Methylomirabilis sp.]
MRAAEIRESRAAGEIVPESPGGIHAGPTHLAVVPNRRELDAPGRICRAQGA